MSINTVNSGIRNSMLQSLTKSTQAEKPDAAETVKKYDANGNGKLDSVEISTLAKELSAQGPGLSAETILQDDADGDGAISVSEMQAGMEARPKSPAGGPGGPGGMAGAGRPAGFESDDADGDGVVDSEELTTVLQNLGSSATAEDIIKTYDEDGDGKLNKEEMTSVMMNIAPPPENQGSSESEAAELTLLNFLNRGDKDDKTEAATLAALLSASNGVAAASGAEE